MSKQVLLWGFISGILATIASAIWDKVYFFAMQTDFSKVINPFSIAGASILGCLLAVVLYTILQKLLNGKHEVVFNFSISILTIASLIAPLSISLPLDIEFPEIFPALALPMHFFPAMALFTLKPLFKV